MEEKLTSEQVKIILTSILAILALSAIFLLTFATEDWMVIASIVFTVLLFFGIIMEFALERTIWKK